MPARASRPTSWTAFTSSSTSRPPLPDDRFAAAASARLGPLAVLHPFPTLLVAAATGAIAAIAGADLARSVALALAMAGFQASIGALNDIHDRSDDEVAKPWKPLPAGRVTFAAARATALGGGLLGFLLSAAAGPAALAIGLIGYGLGVAYDLGLKRTGWGWLAFALALPLVPVYAWVGAAARLPPDTLVVAVMGPLAGLALACANGLVDLERDAVAGGRGVAVRLGRWRATAAIVAADIALVAVAWATSIGERGVTPALVAATVTLAVGAAWSARMAVRWRWLGWQAQAAGVAILAVGWLAGAARAGG